MIYTTYFDNLKLLPKNIIPISICIKPPEWYAGLQYKKLAPHEDFFKEWRINRNNDYYINCFNKQILQHLTVEEVIKDLEVLTKYNNSIDDNIALVCYELPTEFCHRHLISQWFNQHNVFCVEWNGK